MYCACTTCLSFTFDRLYPMTDVSSWEKKVSFFLSFAGSFLWCQQFCPGRTFYFDDFYFIGKPWAKIQKPPGATSILPMFISTISKYDLHHSRYQHTKFHTCMKNHINFRHLLYYFYFHQQKISRQQPKMPFYMCPFIKNKKLSFFTMSVLKQELGH